MAKIITNLKDYIIKSKISLETPKKYLNSDFLNTATYVKLNAPVANFSYLDYNMEYNNDPTYNNRRTIRDSDGNLIENTETRQNFLNVKQKAVTTLQFNLPKTTNSLKEFLCKLLYSKYIEIANNNEKTICNNYKKSISNTFLNKVRNYVYGNNIRILDNTHASFRNLVTRIVQASNNIAMNSRFGPASFIVVSPHFCNLLNSQYFNNYTNEIDIHTSFPKLGTIGDMEVFLNKDEKKSVVLVGRKDSNNEGGMYIGSYSVDINENDIKWRGFVQSISPNAKYMFDILPIQMEESLPWHKKILNKLLKRYNING